MRGDRRAAGQGRRLCGAGRVTLRARIELVFECGGLPMEVVAPWCRRREFRYPEGAGTCTSSIALFGPSRCKCSVSWAPRAPLTLCGFAAGVKVASVIAQRSGSGAQPYERKTAKVSLTVVVLATAFGVLLYTSLGESMQSLGCADEVMASPAEWQGKPLQGPRLRGARFDRAQARHAGISLRPAATAR